jgi:uncharacterized protein YoaH (UPF0181 family)
MTWLDSDRERIRRFLGYSVNQAAVDRIQSAMNQMAGVSEDAIGTCQANLRELEKIWQQINETRPYAAAASYSTAGSSTDYYPGQRLGVLREEGRRYVNEVAEMLQLQVVRDVFAVNQVRGNYLIR